LRAAALRFGTALTEGPPEALDVNASHLSALPDQVAQEANITLGCRRRRSRPIPRPWCGSLADSRACHVTRPEDALLPTPYRWTHLCLILCRWHQADRRDFDTILKTTARQVVCSRARRDTQGRINGVSPLYPRAPGETYRQRARIPEHAAGWTDRLFARPQNSRSCRCSLRALLLDRLAHRATDGP